MLTPFELAYLSCEPFLPPLYRQVRRELRAIAAPFADFRVLDIGGRKSHYTINVPARVVISDLPRETEIQRRLHLGLEAPALSQILRRRSNVETVVYDDMTHTQIPPAAFHCATAVEVLEHVEDDREFLDNVRRVLRPGGIFLMTTPNGDCVPNNNPDHKRHYRRNELEALLKRYFEPVDVHYSIAGGLFYRLSLRSWSGRHPLRTSMAMLGGWMNGWQSQRVRNRAMGTQHLFAIARKP